MGDNDLKEMRRGYMDPSGPRFNSRRVGFWNGRDGPNGANPGCLWNPDFNLFDFCKKRLVVRCADCCHVVDSHSPPRFSAVTVRSVISGSRFNGLLIGKRIKTVS